MGKKRKSEAEVKTDKTVSPNKLKPSPAAKNKKHSKNDETDSDTDADLFDKSKTEEPDFEDEIEEVILPPTEDLHILLNKIELQLPKDDHVKYDSRARKLDWETIRFKEHTAEECRRYWEHIQARIRRFRILAEMIPDARIWLLHPWTNFYKSKDHNRHPEMPKKPLSMYMLYYSERREAIQRDNCSLSMPEVAKICSDEYQKLPEKRKAKFKTRCDLMRKEYDAKLDRFYTEYPLQRPVKAEKSKSNSHRVSNVVRTAEPERPVILLPGAPQKSGKPFDLYFGQLLEQEPGTGTERSVLLEKARQDWREMKVKKKAKWIRKAMKDYREYEEKVVDFKSKHPEFNPPCIKSFLTQEEQKILDKHMGRPEKPPSSAYSLFSKEMLNTEFIKQFPSKERMSHISEAWRKVTDADKEIYQHQVNEAMSKYKTEYNDWFESLTQEEQKAERDRTTTKSSKKSQPMLISNSTTPPSHHPTTPSHHPTQPSHHPTPPSHHPTPPLHHPTPPSHHPTPPSHHIQPVISQPVAIPYPNLQPVSHPMGSQQQMIMKVETMMVPPLPPQVPEPHANPMMPVPVVPTETDRIDAMRIEILRREPVEPARSHKQLFLSDYHKKNRKKDKKSTDEKLFADGKVFWRNMDKKDKRKWVKMLEPQRQRYIEAYTIFVRGLNKEELELYTDMKARRDAEEEAKRAVESSDSEESDSESESESDSDSDSGSDSD